MISINITCSLYSNSVCLQVCDEPHPLLIKEMIGHCEKANIDDVYKILKSLWAVADPGGFHWFPRKPPFKSEDYFNTYIYAAIKNILCTVTQPFLIN